MIKTIGIIGSGKMGTDIFYFLNDYNYKVKLLCMTKAKKEILENKFLKQINRLIKLNIINETEYNLRIKNFNIINDESLLHDCDLIIESIIEDIDIKKQLFRKLDKTINIDCIFTTNSSSIVPSKLFPDSNRYNKFFGLHFFYPVKIKNIAELIFTDKSNKNYLKIIQLFLDNINKNYLLLNEKNSFVINKIFLKFQAEAFKIHNEKNLSFSQIDEIIKKNILPIGVFEFFDNVGLDVIYSSILEYIHNDNNKKIYGPMLDKISSMITKNMLGKKTSQGFYNYNSLNNFNNINQTKTDNKTCIEIEERLFKVYINEFLEYTDKKNISPDKLNFFIKEYMNIEKGPYELINELSYKKSC